MNEHLKSFLNNGAEILYQSPNANSVLQTLLQVSRYSTNETDNETIPQDSLNQTKAKEQGNKMAGVGEQSQSHHLINDFDFLHPADKTIPQDSLNQIEVNYRKLQLIVGASNPHTSRPAELNASNETLLGANAHLSAAIARNFEAISNPAEPNINISKPQLSVEISPTGVAPAISRPSPLTRVEDSIAATSLQASSDTSSKTISQDSSDCQAQLKSTDSSDESTQITHKRCK